MRFYSLITLLILISSLFGTSLYGFNKGLDLTSDSLKILDAIEQSYSFYSEFEMDSSLAYAEQALNLSKALFNSEAIKANTADFSHVKTLLAESYAHYGVVLREIDLTGSEDTLLAVIPLFEETDFYELGLIYSELGRTYEFKSQSEKALKYATMAMEAFQNSDDQVGYMNELINVGLILRGEGNYGKSLENFIESLTIARQLNDSTGIVESLLAMGFVYSFVEKWDDAVKSQQEALEIFQASEDEWGIARVYNDMGLMYEVAGEFDSSLVYHNAALAFRLKSKDTYNTFSSYLYIGDIHAKKEDVQEAILAYEKALLLADQIEFKTIVADAYLNQGDNYLLISDLPKAKELIDVALTLSEEIEYDTGIASATVYLAKIAELNGQKQLALRYLKASEKIMAKAYLQVQTKLYEDISEIYYKLEDYKNAYLSRLSYITVRDSVKEAESISKITQMTNVMNFENELALKKESNEKLIAIKQVEVDRERTTRNFFISGMILALVMGGITFIRFREKKKLNQKLNTTLENLKSTQAQLIQSEKMASLGELTAGIAHEIQNPLNFVNNFSELNKELVEEANEELANGDIEETKAILKDLGSNSEKINLHGKRADAIVKGMLEHSRINKGEKAPTDLNALADEFVRLSYHGLCAKNKEFNADFTLELDPNLPKVNIVASDIGRVILNLVNNAFYAVHEKAKTVNADSDYIPIITVSSNYSLLTGGQGGSIQISIKDNGSGIPDSIKEKIFQPFFTTKPTGSGTGLGLSYDIVKAHGGEIRVESREGKGTEFILTLNT